MINLSDKDKKNFENLEAGYLSFADKLKIDKFRLDDEIVEQPSVYEEVCNMVSNLYGQRDLLEYQLRFRESELSLIIAKRLLSEGTRPTEKLINSEVTVDDEIQRLQNLFLAYDAKHKQWDNLKRCFEQRMEALQGEIRLLSCGYSAYSRKFD